MVENRESPKPEPAESLTKRFLHDLEDHFPGATERLEEVLEEKFGRQRDGVGAQGRVRPSRLEPAEE